MKDRYQRSAKVHSRPGESSGLFVVHGRNPVRELLRSGIATEVELEKTAHGKVISEILDLAHENGIRVRTLDRFEEDEGTVSQGVRALAPPPVLRTDLIPFVEAFDEDQQPLLLMLDGITDPHNFGAILRTAEGAGVAGVIVRERRQAPITGTVVKASAGAAYLLPIFQVNNVVRTVEDLRDYGYWSVAAASGKAQKLYTDYDWERRVLLIVGAEGAGVSSLVLEKADDTISLPMLGQIESLNVSVATGILLYHATTAKK